MTSEILLSVIAFLSGVTTVLNFISSRKQKNVDEGRADGQIHSDLQYIKSVMLDVRSETKEINKLVDAHAERLAKGEEGIKQAHKRLNDHETRIHDIEKKVGV